MVEWPSTTLADACAGAGFIQTGPFGSQLHKADYRNSGVPVIMPTNIRDGRIVEDGIAYIDEEDAKRLHRHRVSAGDIVFSRRGEIDKCAVITPRENGWLCGTGCLLARPNAKKANPYFLGYSINTHASKTWLRQHAVGATMPNLNTGILERLPVPWPGKAIQDQVAEVLTTIDDKIELNRQMNETLEASARALFRDWFVDFGPTKAKMAGDAPYLASDLWSLFPARLDDDGLPEGWAQSDVGKHCTNFDSKRVPVSKGERAKRQGPYPYHGATSVMDYIDDYLFDGIYVLVGEDGSVVKPDGRAFTQYVSGKIWVNNHAHVLQGKGSVSTEQLLLFFRHALISPYITGAVQLKLSQKRMNGIPFVYAGEAICNAFGSCVAPLFSRIRANEAENLTLAQTRDLLLPKLMSGEIRVGEAEKTISKTA